MTDHRAPWDAGPAPGRPALPPDQAKPPPKPRGRRPLALHAPAPGAGASPDWLYHHLTASGPAGPLAAFVAAARGPGAVPWRHDFAALEEDMFNLAAAQPPAQRRLGAEGCRVLARQFRAQVEAHQARAARAGHSLACPFDLHALLPVPDSVLRQGPAHPAALAWLSGHWGTTGRLRHVVPRPGATAGRRLPRGHGVAGYGFFASGGTPHAALAQLGPRWPALRFVLQPRPAG